MIRPYTTGPLKRLVREPAFVVCTLTLAICAMGLQLGAEKMKLYFRKMPVPLQKTLDELDASKLVPFELVKAQKIENEDVLEELGTEDYIQWELEDTSLKANNPLRRVRLDITYYTGDPGKVPHVPEVCYLGSGGRIKERIDREIHVLKANTKNDKIPVRLLDIELNSQFGQLNRVVVYFFKVNDTYRCDRNQVRRAQNNLHDKYAYFSKVEVSILHTGPISHEDALATAEKLHQKLVPILLAEHWPKWENLNETAKEASRQKQ